MSSVEPKQKDENEAAMNATPKVSVFMVTYNHEKYIAQSIDSVIMQRTDFPVKLYIGEDHSTDQTARLCMHYAQKYPDKVNVICNSKNLGPNNNAFQVFNRCIQSGAEFIAMLEGDDYWTDCRKLQKQVDILDSCAGYSMVYHDVDVISERQLHHEIYGDPIHDATTEDMLRSRFIPTLSLVFRNVLGSKDYIMKGIAASGDFALELILSLYGKAYYLPEKMGCYRAHTGGITADTEKIITRELCDMRFLGKFNDMSRSKYKDSIIARQKKMIGGCISQIGYFQSRRRRILLAARLFHAMFRIRTFNSISHARFIAQQTIRLLRMTFA